MLVIVGATGNIRIKTTEILLARGEKVRVVCSRSTASN